LHEADHDELRRNAVQKVQSKYSQTYVSQRYIEVYNQALAIKEFHL
jgi:glycosyltransferase, group 1 family